MPPIETLFLNKFVNNTALFNIYLVRLAYKLDTELRYDSTNDFEGAKKYLLTQLPANSVIEKILVYNCNNVISKKNRYGGFILQFMGVAFIILRGTKYASEMYEDVKEALITPYWLNEEKVHTGFNNIYINPKNDSNVKCLREQILDCLTSISYDKIFVAGHSLGGALSYLLEADLSLRLPELRYKTNFYIFAGPYTGNEKFVNLILSVNKNGNFTGTFSMINTYDPVPNLRSPYYRRVPSQLFCVSDTGISDGHNPHSLELYEKQLQKLHNIVAFNTNVFLGKASCGPIFCGDAKIEKMNSIKHIQKESFNFSLAKQYNLKMYIIIFILTIFLVFLCGYLFVYVKNYFQTLNVKNKIRK
jgi:Lipase (class 3)